MSDGTQIEIKMKEKRSNIPARSRGRSLNIRENELRLILCCVEMGSTHLSAWCLNSNTSYLCVLM